MIKERHIIDTFSEHLFWDIDRKKIDTKTHAVYIIPQVVQYGLYSDWEKIRNLYGIKKIVDVCLKIRDIDKKSATFLSLLSGVQREKFSCYTTKQSTPKPWNF